MRVKAVKRDEKIRAWRSKRVSQAVMASRLGITRQRVQQIESRLRLGPRRLPGARRLHQAKCAYCGALFSVRVPGRKFCSRACFFASRKVTRSKAEQRKFDERRSARNRLRSKHYYHNVFKNRKNWRAIVKDRNRRYARQRS